MRCFELNIHRGLYCALLGERELRAQPHLACHGLGGTAQPGSARLGVTNANLPGFVLRHIPSKQKEVNMTRNLIGLLETALEIALAKANGCDGGDCSCGEGDGCLAEGWESFLPPQQNKLLLDEKRRNQLQIAFTSLVPMRLPIL